MCVRAVRTRQPSHPCHFTSSVVLLFLLIFNICSDSPPPSSGGQTQLDSEFIIQPDKHGPTVCSAVSPLSLGELTGSCSCWNTRSNLRRRPDRRDSLKSRRFRIIKLQYEGFSAGQWMIGAVRWSSKQGLAVTETATGCWELAPLVEKRSDWSALDVTEGSSNPNLCLRPSPFQMFSMDSFPDGRVK